MRPSSYVAHYNLAKALLSLGDRSRAAQEASASIALSPSPDALALLTQIEAAP